MLTKDICSSAITEAYTQALNLARRPFVFFGLVVVMAAVPHSSLGKVDYGGVHMKSTRYAETRVSLLAWIRAYCAESASAVKMGAA